MTDSTIWLTAYDFREDYWAYETADKEFRVPREWAEKYFREHLEGSETNGFIDKEHYETLDDFLNDYILDEMNPVYEQAIKDGVILEEVLVTTL